MSIDTTNYDFEPKVADYLKGIVLHDTEIRRECIAVMRDKFGDDAVIESFVQFIGLANSVMYNQRDFLELYAITEMDMHPNTAEKINFPSIFGALLGVGLAKYGCEKACSGCAFRLGSHANQSETTTGDADWCGHPGEPPFMCHENLDEGEPTKVCAGWLRLRQERKKTP